jgi:DNA-binding response OmpR family regulator
MKKILVVDDENDVLISLKQGLEDSAKDIQVLTAKSGMQCFEILKNGEKPDIIILDIMMPGMNGWQVLNRLRENPEWNNIPVVFLTAKNDDFTKTFGKSITADFIEKPFELDNIKKRINYILDKVNKGQHCMQ